jgi:SecD/SecF fusion protein
MVDKYAWMKWTLLGVLTVLSLWCVIPTDKIRLGLDLQGGTSFIVKIDEDRLRDDIRSDVEARVRTEVRSEAGKPGTAWTNEEAEVRSRMESTETSDHVANEVKKRLEGAPARVLEVIRNRVDNLGISEPEIRLLGQDRIQVQLPGTDEAKRREAETAIKSAAFLEFRLVHPRNGELVRKMFGEQAAPEGYRIGRVGKEEAYITDEAFARKKREDPGYRSRLSRFRVPDVTCEFMLERINGAPGEVGYRPVFVERKRQLSGELLDSAAVDYRATMEAVIDISFNAKGKRVFGDVTERYGPRGSDNPGDTGRQLAIVMDGTLYCAPFIREAIWQGRAEISGSFTDQEAQLLVRVLRAGSLPVPVRIEDMRYVSPTLGQDSIKSGVFSAVLGGGLVVLFMSIYYLLNGVIASGALILNLIMLPLGMIVTAGIMSLFVPDAVGMGSKVQLPVLTLPGIAGIALTFGMSVDANVLIAERMREEARTGKRFWGVVTAGYDRAFLAILDTNLTVLLTGALMFVFGSGPIRGYAVTLCAGIIVSMYTALTCTKMVYAMKGENGTLGMLKMLQIIPETKIDFVKWRVPAISLSLLVIVGSWGSMALKYRHNPADVLGVDFLGGNAVTFACKDGMTRSDLPPIQDIRNAISVSGVADADIQYQADIKAGGRDVLVVRTGTDLMKKVDVTGKTVEVKPVEVVAGALAEKFPAAGFMVLQEDSVGPQIGRELKVKAMWAMGIALVGMIIFLWWRFEISFGVAATVALFHDVLVTAGIYAATGREFNLPTIAALLTIIGYSVNDTIVIFDRIRENLRIDKQRSFVDLCNLSMNQTLSRTLITSFMAFITVVMLLIFGGGALHDFALTMFIGMIAGTYSTMYIATPVVILWHRGKRPELGSARTTA